MWCDELHKRSNFKTSTTSSMQHPFVSGLHQVVELVKDRDSKEPLGEFNQPLSPPMAQLVAALREFGMSTFVKWNWLFCAPPLVINEEQLAEGISIIDRAMEKMEV